jgi:hypothetical protein
MQLDLAAAAEQIANARKALVRHVRTEWRGGKIELDEVGFVARVVNALAAAMAANLYRGMKPDGSGPMPGRKLDGQPRGKGAAIARALDAVRQGDRLEWLIAAHKETPGHLARIMRDVEFRAPSLDMIRVAIGRAFERSIVVGALGSAIPGGGRHRLDSGRWGRNAKFGALVRPQGAYGKTLRGQFLRWKIAQRKQARKSR